MKNILKISGIILAVILIDQIAKGLLLGSVVGGWQWLGSACDLTPFFCDGAGQIVHGADFANLPATSWFKFVFVWNPGTSFSLFRALGTAAPLILVVLTAAIIGFLGHFLFMRAKPREKLPLALIVGGALGNLIDRVRFGAVIDFLDFHIGNWHWPAFNIADICICIGVGLYILNWVLEKKKK
jgi:signal peptidase II